MPEDRDGACFFRGVARQLFGDPNLHGRVRREVCDHMQRHADHFESFISGGTLAGHLVEMRKPATWGGQAEVVAVEELYDRYIQIFRIDELPYGVPVPRTFPDVLNDSVQPLRLSYGRSHYNSVTKSGADQLPLIKGSDDMCEGLILKHRQQQQPPQVPSPHHDGANSTNASGAANGGRPCWAERRY